VTRSLLGLIGALSSSLQISPHIVPFCATIGMNFKFSNVFISNLNLVPLPYLFIINTNLLLLTQNWISTYSVHFNSVADLSKLVDSRLTCILHIATS